MAIFYKLPGCPLKSVDDEDFWEAKKLTAGIDTDDIDPDSFAAACYDANSIDELLCELRAKPSAVDMELWAITPEEWRAEMLLGLAALVKEVEEHAEGEV